MSSLFEIPAQLAMLLSLAASTAGHEQTAAAVAAEFAVASDVAIVPEPLEGPLRFGERAWLRALHENPGEAGADSYSGRVFVTSGGRFYVPTASDRRRILDARNDFVLATRVARAAADRNAIRMHAALHRTPTAGDLYIAHVFGPEAAISLLETAGKSPDLEVKKRFPELAGIGQEVGDASAGPMTVGKFYRRLSGALREPPRLVAIGLKPSVADASPQDLLAERAQDSKVAWQTQVNVAKADRPIQ